MILAATLGKGSTKLVNDASIGCFCDKLDAHLDNQFEFLKYCSNVLCLQESMNNSTSDLDIALTISIEFFVFNAFSTSAFLSALIPRPSLPYSVVKDLIRYVLFDSTIFAKFLISEFNTTALSPNKPVLRPQSVID